MSADDSDVCRITVLASGSGSNFQALIDGIEDGRIPNCKIAKLFVNRAKAYGGSELHNPARSSSRG